MKTMDNTGIRHAMEIVVIVEYTSLEMYAYHLMCKRFSNFLYNFCLKHFCSDK
jgi:hypothetical protein